MYRSDSLQLLRWWKINFSLVLDSIMKLCGRFVNFSSNPSSTFHKHLRLPEGFPELHAMLCTTYWSTLLLVYAIASLFLSMLFFFNPGICLNSATITMYVYQSSFFICVAPSLLDLQSFFIRTLIFSIFFVVRLFRIRPFVHHGTLSQFITWAAFYLYQPLPPNGRTNIKHQNLMDAWY